MNIRHTQPDDLPRIMAIYEKARHCMQASGNPSQWVNGYPDRAMIEKDIEKQSSYVCLDGTEIVATFYFAIEEEPNYAKIYEGHWSNDKEYGVIHRIAVDSQKKGTATFCLEWCFDQINNIRIDTHQDNLAMQRVLEKNGYLFCGKIFLPNGSSRIAFQKS